MHYVVAITNGSRLKLRIEHIEQALCCRAYLGPNPGEVIVSLPNNVEEMTLGVIEQKLKELGLQVIERG